MESRMFYKQLINVNGDEHEHLNEHQAQNVSRLLMLAV